MFGFTKPGPEKVEKRRKLEASKKQPQQYDGVEGRLALSPEGIVRETQSREF